MKTAVIVTTYNRPDALAAVLDPPSIALDNALALQKAEALSVTDDLTRLYNSRYLNLVLRREAKRSMRSGRALSLLFIDLDGFKAVNDNHGHLSGGKALVEAGTPLASAPERHPDDDDLADKYEMADELLERAARSDHRVVRLLGGGDRQRAAVGAYRVGDRLGSR